MKYDFMMMLEDTLHDIKTTGEGTKTKEGIRTMAFQQLSILIAK